MFTNAAVLVKRILLVLTILLGVSLWSIVSFNAGRLIGSAQTLEYQARISNNLLGIDSRTLATYLRSAEFVLKESTWRLLPISPDITYKNEHSASR